MQLFFLAVFVTVHVRSRADGAEAAEHIRPSDQLIYSLDCQKITQLPADWRMKNKWLKLEKLFLFFFKSDPCLAIAFSLVWKKRLASSPTTGNNKALNFD